MFKNLFKKRDSEAGLEEVIKAVDHSTLKILDHQLFMHYFNKATTPDPEDPAWKNQGIFFWSAKEAFKHKSLPPDFKNLEKKHFIVRKLPEEISIFKGVVAPWFGMPGGGEKYFFKKDDLQIPINDLVNSNSLSYIRITELNENNLNVLKDRENYYILLDSNIVKYDPTLNNFYFKNKISSLGEAYKKGGVKIIQFKRSANNLQND